MHPIDAYSVCERLCNLKIKSSIFISDVSHGHFNFQSNVRAAVSRRFTRIFQHSQQKTFFFTAIIHCVHTRHDNCKYHMQLPAKMRFDGGGGFTFSKRRNKWKFGAKFVTLKVAQMEEWKVNTSRSRSTIRPQSYVSQFPARHRTARNTLFATRSM